MTEIFKISNRLTTIAVFLPKGVFFADIGSDHAYLPCYVCKKDPHAKAIAGEVNVGPFKKALETVKSFQLENAITVRLGSGLQVIHAEQVTHVVIAGMGGALIESILSEGKEKLRSVNRIITQPNVDTISVRRWFNENGFTITEEVIVKENDHIYEIVVADKSNSSNRIKLTEKQLLLGPLLLKTKPKEFYKKWKFEIDKLQSIVNDMRKAKVIDNAKVEQFKVKIGWIKEVLLDEEGDN